MRKAIVFLTAFLLAAPIAWGQQQELRDILRVKGQEEVTLQGMGLVVGLSGTGDKSFTPATRALATMMQHMGNPVGRDQAGGPVLDELKNAQNIALVTVTATVPGSGASEGDRLMCYVHSVNNAKSLEGGYLLTTPMTAPLPGSQVVHGFAQGPLRVENSSNGRVAKVYRGCRLERNFRHPYMTEDGRLTLVLKNAHAGFQNAREVERLINDTYASRYSTYEGDGGEGIARALDAVSIEVLIPTAYRETPVQFISEIESLRILGSNTEARVVINEQAGLIVVGANVEIGPCAIAHKNITVEAGVDDGRFTPIDPLKRATRLKDLVDALNAIKASPQDIIDIIKGIERDGQLYGKLVIE